MGRRSQVWSKFYDHPTTPGISICKICRVHVHRGGKTGTNTNTTNFLSLFASKHPTEFEKLKSPSSMLSSTSSKHSVLQPIGALATSSDDGADDLGLNEDDDVIQTSPPPAIKRQSKL